MGRLVLVVSFLSPALVWAEARTITILYTSDVHARVHEVDEVRRRPAAGSLAQVASYVAGVRREHPFTVVLDGGDAIQGTPLAHYALAVPGGDGLDPTVIAMNFIGYDAAVLGNHEFNYGLGVLGRSVLQARFPWLAANLEGAGAAGLEVAPGTILTRGGVRIGVLGLTNPNVPNWDLPSRWEGLVFLDPLAVARTQIAALRPQVDVLIVVAHTGFERDLETGELLSSGPEQFAWALSQLEGIDVLLTGHTHRNIPPRMLGGTVVAQPGRWAEWVSRVDVHLEQREGEWVVAGWQGEQASMNGIPPHEGVLRAVDGLRRRMEEELGRVVGRLASPLAVGGVPTADHPAVDLVHHVQLRATGAQLSLAAPLAMATQEFAAGEVTPRELHALYPFPNTLVAVTLTGAQLRDVMEHAVRGWSGVECQQPASCALHRDPALPGYGYDTLEGATYVVDVTQPAGSRIRGLRVNGEPVDPDQEFSVALNSYRAAGSGGFPHLKSAPRLREIDRQMVDLLADYFATEGVVSPRASENFFFVIPLAAAPGTPRTPMR